MCSESSANRLRSGLYSCPNIRCSPMRSVKCCSSPSYSLMLFFTRNICSCISTFESGLPCACRVRISKMTLANEGGFDSMGGEVGCSCCGGRGCGFGVDCGDGVGCGNGADSCAFGGSDAVSAFSSSISSASQPCKSLSCDSICRSLRLLISSTRFCFC